MEQQRHYCWRVKDRTMPWRNEADSWRTLSWRMTEEEAAAYAKKYGLEVQRIDCVREPAEANLLAP
jgi:hypothetical protein